MLQFMQNASDKSIDIIEYKLKEELVNSMQWMKRDKLTLNLKKTQYMLIGTKQRLVKCRKICIEINNVVLETVDVAKLLGVNIDCSSS